MPLKRKAKRRVKSYTEPNPPKVEVVEETQTFYDYIKETYPESEWSASKDRACTKIGGALLTLIKSDDVYTVEIWPDEAAYYEDDKDLVLYGAKSKNLCRSLSNVLTEFMIDLERDVARVRKIINHASESPT